jgi:hypothetical protein
MYSRSAKGGEKGDPNRNPWLAKMIQHRHLFQYRKFKGDLIVSKMFDIETSACSIQGWKFTGAQSVTPKT